MGLTSAVHLFLGTGDIMTPIMITETLHPAIRATAMVVWHMVSLMLVLLTLAIAYLALKPNPPLFWFVIALQLGSAMVFLFFNISHFGSFFVMPQWTVFVLCPLLMLAPRLRAA